jgi:cytochrome c peroxidase
MRLSFLLPLTALASVALFTGCSSSAPKAAVEIDASKLKFFAPLPDVMAAKSGPPAAELTSLGKLLYFEHRLSRSHKFSCNSCHQLDKYGVDNQPTSEGHKGQRGDRNSPTVYNAATHFVQFWDGRAANVEEQAAGPVMNPVEMAMKSEADVVATLSSMPEYVDAFAKAFPGEKQPISLANMAKAIGAFERMLVTPSRWDKFLKGDAAALTDEEKQGFNAFIAAGCQTCHMGVNLGGSSFQKLGQVKPYEDESDPGRAKVTKSDADKLMFKVPGLRNIEKTAPYYHNGKVATLKEAVSHMAEYQLGKTLSDQEQNLIIAFLKSLTGDLPAAHIQPPDLPKSTAKTPQPDLT